MSRDKNIVPFKVLDLNFKVGKFEISKLIIGVDNPEEISENISERVLSWM